MARKKSDEKDEMPTVLVLSRRIGDIILFDGQLLAYNKTLRVDAETADWLVATYKEGVLKLEE